MGTLKNGRFSIRASEEVECGHRYSLYDLTYYPDVTLHARQGLCGPTALLAIRSLLDGDLHRLPDFMERLQAAGKSLVNPAHPAEVPARTS